MAKRKKAKYKVRYYLGRRRKVSESRKTFRKRNTAKKYCDKLKKKNPKIKRCSMFRVTKSFI